MGRNRRWHKLPEAVRREIVEAARRGKTRAEILTLVDVSAGTVTSVLRPLGGVHRRDAVQPWVRRLSYDERVEILLGVRHGDSVRQIARDLGRDPATISRELKANGGRERYRPGPAHERAVRAARRPKPTRLVAHPGLCEAVADGLQRLWSPEQISKRLRRDFGDDADMQISHETIYKALYVQGRGELRAELARCLRRGRAQRLPRQRLHRRGAIPDKVMISDRPAEVADRAVPGHWEGDLIVGKANGSAVGTLVERTTRYVMLLHLPGGRGAEQVREAMTTAIRRLPDTLRRSITWDQGKEMSQHAQFTIDAGVQIYFCDPQSPWQRGTNENTNGLLRQYLPKGTDLSVHDAHALQTIADSLNDRPRKTLDWMTPSEKLAELLCVATTG